jgi:exosortase
MNVRGLTRRLVQIGPLGIWAGVTCAILLWSYWPTLLDMERRWAKDPRYSHGYLVAPFAIYLLWSRWHLKPGQPVPSSLGPLLLLLSSGLRFIGAYYYLSWFEALSFISSVGGLCLLFGGWAGVRWAWPAIAFLIFMVPLPYRFEMALGSPLQHIATVVSTYALQVCGLPAFSSGNTILINDFTLGIIDACNGLGTAYMFLACAVAAAFMIPRPILDRVLLIASAIPIALVANVSRITATGLLHEMFGKAVSDVVYHDLAGWLMMFLAVGILSLESHLLPKLFIETTPANVDPIEPASESRVGSARSAVGGKGRIGIAIALAIAILLVSGIAHGRWTNRWVTSRELDEALARLDHVPSTIGDWQSRAEAIEPRALSSAGLEGGNLRRYRNTRTGVVIDLLVVCGRPGPVSVHTPDICYSGAGYEAAQPSGGSTTVHLGPPTATGEFSIADFEKPGTFPREALRIYWSWSARGDWTVPANPRMAFAARPFLYKLYLILPGNGDFGQPGNDAISRFARALLPELRTALFPDGGARPGGGSADTH